MTQKVILPLNGAMNKDVAPAYIKSEQGEVFERRNARVVSVAGSKTAYNTSLKGTTLLGSYTNHVALGSIEDIKNDRVLFFLKDISNSDKIISVSRPQGNSTTHTITTLFESTVFNFNVNYPIDADIIDDYLVFTDAVNPPRKLYIGSDTNLRPAVVDSNTIQLAVRPPLEAPVIGLGSDSSRRINLILGKSFQFAYQYIYKDYTYSTLSPYSQLAVSSSIFAADTQTYVDENKSNFISVTYDVGSLDVKTVRILARENNTGSWFVVEEYDRGNEPEDSLGSFSFYNDRVRRNLPSHEALALYSDVPLLANSVLAVKNRVGLAGITKGYDKTDVNASYTLEYNSVDVTPAIIDIPIGGSNIGYDVYTGFNIPTIVMPDYIGRTVSININIQINTKREVEGFNYIDYCIYNLVYSGSYVIKSGDTKADIIAWFVTDINLKNVFDLIFYDGNPGGAYFNASSGAGGYDVALVGVSVIPTDDPYLWNSTFDASSGAIIKAARGVNTYKSGSYVNVGMVYYDDFGRTSGVLNPTRVYIPSNGERAYADAYKQALIKFSITNTTPPSWATKYRFAVSEAINILSVYPFVVGSSTSKNALEVYLDNRKCIALNMPTNFNYVFANGDYLLWEEDSGSAITTTVKSIVGVRSTIEYNSETLSGNWLIITMGNNAAAEYVEQLCYVVRPKSEISDTVFYEDYRTYDIIGGELQTLTGYVGDGDAWFVSRTYRWDDNVASKTTTVEDFVISVEDGFRAFSKGRPIVDLGDLGKQQEFQHFVWSKQYLDNTKINGLAFFESTARVELDEKNGRIARVKLVGDVIKCVQTNKETSMYVGKQQISNADGTLSLVSTANFIGTVYPSDENTGTNYKKSVIVNDRNLYYWDGKRGEVIRSAPNGQFPISSSNMKSYFYYLKTQLDGAYWSDAVFHFDNRYNELVCTFSWRRTSTSIFNSETLVYSEDIGGWTYFYDLKHTLTSVNIGSDIYGKIGEANYAFNYGTLWEMDSNTANNTIFNAVKPLSIIPYVNIAPASEKCLKAVETDSNIALTVSFDSDAANTRPLGNYTYLVPASFRNREGLYVSAINRNIRTSIGNNVSLLYSGNLMTGKYFKATLSNNTSGEVEIRFMTVGYVPSV